MGGPRAGRAGGVSALLVSPGFGEGGVDQLAGHDLDELSQVAGGEDVGGGGDGAGRGTIAGQGAPWVQSW
ncbi:hypothetical protein GCM10023405_50980 [Streptomonospora salina]